MLNPQRSLFMAYEAISKSIENKGNFRLSKLGLECKVEDPVFTGERRGGSGCN